MVQGFLPFHDGLYNCLEDVLACIAVGFGRGHMLMYARAWNFSFFPAGRQSSIIGNRVDAGEYSAWVCLEKYHGVQSKCHFNAAAEGQLEVLREELSEQRPVVLWLDGYYVPWTNVYNKLHMKHFLIAIDFCAEQQCIKVLDPYWNKEINSLSLKSFKLSKAKCITLSLTDKEPQALWYELMGNAAREIQRAGAFDAMRSFAGEIGAAIDMKIEIKGFEELKYNSPIFMQLAEIFFRRLNFSRLMEYMGKRDGVENLQALAGDMASAGNGWKKARDMLIRAMEDSTSGESIKEFTARVMELADYEEKLACKLLSLAEVQK